MWLETKKKSLRGAHGRQLQERKPFLLADLTAGAPESLMVSMANNYSVLPWK